MKDILAEDNYSELEYLIKEDRECSPNFIHFMRFLLLQTNLTFSVAKIGRSIRLLVNYDFMFVEDNYK